MKAMKIYIVDSNRSLINELEEVLLQNQHLNIDIVGKAYTKNEFFYNRDAITQSDAFIIAANLPDGTGIELLEYVKKNESISNKPVFITVDKRTRKYIGVASEKGATKVFQKPISFRELLVEIDKLRETNLNKQTDSEIPENNSTELSPEDLLNEEFNVNDELNSAEVDHQDLLKDDHHYDKETISDIFEDHSGYSDLDADRQEMFDEIDSSTMLNVNQKKEEDDEERKKVINTINSNHRGLFTFLSPSSTGKSSLIVNIAYALRTIPKEKPSVCIVDLNLLFPNISFMFNQNELRKPNNDIYDVAADISYLDDELIQNSMFKHGPTDIYILNTPADKNSVVKTNTIKSEEIEKILTKLKEMFDVVLVDTGTDITNLTVVTSVEFSDKLYVILEPNYNNVVDANKIFYLLEKLEETIQEDIIEKTSLLLNKEAKNRDLDDDTVQKFLKGKKFIAKIPEDPKFLTYLNKGKFIVKSDSLASRPIIDLANHIHPFSQSDNKKRKISIPDFKDIGKIFRRK